MQNGSNKTATPIPYNNTNTNTYKNKFVKPTPKEVNDYAKEIDFKLDGDYFCDWNEARGWLVSKNPMKDWKAAIRTWKRNAKNFEPNTPTKIKLK